MEKIVVVDEERLARLEEKIDKLLSDKSNDDDTVLTVSDVSEWLGVSKQTIYDRVKNGEITSFKSGHVILFLKGILKKELFQ